MKWETIVTIIIAIGSIIQLFILVRFISKSEFGQMAMINIVIAFSNIFLDFGVSSGIIHKQEVNREQLSSLYWLSILIGSTFTIFLYLGSSQIAFFYNEPALTLLVQLIAPLFFIQSIGLQYQVILKKNLRFKTLSLIRFWAFLCSFVITIVLAVFHVGVLALVLGRLSKSILENALFLKLGRESFLPLFRIRFANISYFLWFGGFQLGERFLNFFNRQMDVILIGKFLGSEALGIYDVLKKILSRPFQMLSAISNGVSFPILSKVQDDERKLAGYYLKHLKYVCCLNFSTYAFFFCNASLILFTLLGPDWMNHTQLFVLMSAYFLIYSSGNPVGSLLLARGLPNLGFYWNFLTAGLILVLLLLGLTYGLQGIAIALLLGQVLLVFPNYALLVNRAVAIPMKRYLNTFVVPSIIGLSVGMASFLFSLFLSGDDILELTLVSSFAIVMFFSLNRHINNSFYQDFKQLLWR